MANNENVLKELIKKLYNLKEGLYYNGNYIMNIEKLNYISSTTRCVPITVNIEDNEYTYCFDIQGINEYKISVKSKTNNTEVYYEYDINGRKNITAYFKVLEEEFCMNPGLIRANDINYYTYKGGLKRKINDECYIAHDIYKNQKIYSPKETYVFYKRYDTNTQVFPEDYIFFPYTKEFEMIRDIFNSAIDNFKKDLKSKCHTYEFMNLFKSININTLETNLMSEIEELKRVYEIFINNKNLLENIESEDFINKISNIVEDLKYTEEEKEIRDLKNSINKFDFTNINNLIDLQNKIEKIIKSKKNTDGITKTLKNK